MAAVEGKNKIRTGKLVSLSEQELVDCDAEEHGCKNGDNNRAFAWIQRNGGITSRADYPYTGVKGACQKTKLAHHAATVAGVRRVKPNNEVALMEAVAGQPVAVWVKVDHPDFKNFRGQGVYRGRCGRKLNHIVVVVGYGKDPATGEKYWIVKNSWGTNWGGGGYIKMKRQVPGRTGGYCAIAFKPSYPTM